MKSEVVGLMDAADRITVPSHMGFRCIPLSVMIVGACLCFFVAVDRGGWG